VGSREARVAKNEDEFRDWNERRADASDEPILTLVCECAEELCTLPLHVTAEAYQQVRANPRRFIVLPGHEARGNVEVLVEQHGTFVVVEKIGEAGEVAEELAGDAP
jgi:hypothetical protein